MEISQDACVRLAEDASYRLWEFINNVKIYARHSGGTVTYDLVNEVMRDADVTPGLGAMDSEFDRIEYDGSFFFYSDKMVELRDEYQKELSICVPQGADLTFSWPLEEKSYELIKQYIPSIVYVCLYGDADALEKILIEMARSPVLGSGYRMLLGKIIQILAFKQVDAISERCWRLLRACASNPYIRDVCCREQYFHLTEIFICQLLGPYESIKSNSLSFDADVKPTIFDDGKKEPIDVDMTETYENNTEEKIYKLISDDSNEAEVVEISETQLSPYYASPVELKYVNDLCQTIGHLAALNGFFHDECLSHIVRRLERFFAGRNVSTEKEFNYISRAIRCLISLGEYAFREFIPFIYKMKVDIIPESLANDFAVGAVFLKGANDIFLYEWLEYICGADKLQPFLVYYARYHEKLLTYRHLHRRKPTFYITPRATVRRLEWNALAAAMCHGDDPNKALKPKPTLYEIFPEFYVPNINPKIRFKFPGCRPVMIKPKHGTMAAERARLKMETLTFVTRFRGNGFTNSNDILIARRKLLRPMTNTKRVVQLSSYHYGRL